VPRFRVINANCRDVLPRLGLRFDLLFADPPFGIGHGYDGFVDEFDDYEGFTRGWVSAAWEATKGVMCLHGPDRLAALYVDLEKELGFRGRRIAWVNWHYRFGQCRRTNWIDARCHCLIYAKSDDFVWNPDAVLVESDRVRYKDKRVARTENGGSRVPGTVWGVPSDGPHWGRVQGTSRERWKNHPNQLPCNYLRRLILAYTAPGGVVCDPFCGSGTAGLVATREGRDFVGIDVSAPNAASARERIRKGFYRRG
jgi:DNA modification methylase